MDVQHMKPPERQPKIQRKVSSWLRLLLGIIAIGCLIAAGIAWILSTGRVIPVEWATILLIAFAVISVVFAFCQWVFPFSPLSLTPTPPTQVQTTQLFVPVHSTTHMETQFSDRPPPDLVTPLSIWNVPYRRNPFFTGRESLLKQLHENLTMTKTAALTQAQAISGLGGIGKTQIALEYAYSYSDEYHAVFWARAAMKEALISDFVIIAGVLHLPEKDEQDQNKVVAAVKEWMTTHEKWLLILDNADDLRIAYDFIPTSSTGHILLTTRTQITGSIATSIEVDKMDEKEGILLLLRRSKLLATDAPLNQVSQEDQNSAQAIVKQMDGLPLALDQAGAYIDETKCGVSAYLTLYQTKRKELLGKRSPLSPDYSATVTTTWTLSFQKVKQINKPAADLLLFCAFLAPDAIPEEIITQGASQLGKLLRPIAIDPYQLNEAIEILRRYSFVRRNPATKTLSIHRLVQVVIKDNLHTKMRCQWAERTVRAVDQVFPEVSSETWTQCERILPKAIECEKLINEYGLVFLEGARLLNFAASYLHDHARYSEAKLFYQRALTICEKVLKPEDPIRATILNNLAELYYMQGEYERAEPLYQRALIIREKVWGLEDPEGDAAQSLNGLALLYQAQGKYEQAEPLFKRALVILEQQLGPDHPGTALSLNNLAGLYYTQGEYEQAEPLFKRALVILEQQLGPDHPSTKTFRLNYLITRNDMRKNN